MTIDHKEAYYKFVDLLETRRSEGTDDIDIRDHVLSLRNGEIGVGYVQQTLHHSYGANLPRLFPNLRALEDPEWQTCDLFLILGTLYDDVTKSHKGGLRMFNRLTGSEPVLFFEQGFLASTHSWAHSFREKNPDFACLGYVYDDISHYFMADYPNRLIQRLNSNLELSETEGVRASVLIERIVAQRISKYNAQPMACPTMTKGYARRVLVCDQAYADASTVYGKIDDVGFERMLLAAIRENPDAEILVKSHPDTAWEKDKRAGYYSHLKETGRVRILRDPINPYVLFEQVDTVYVGTSQMGLEALFAGKQVVCYGAPFYAGWGLTDDRQKVPHRNRKRSLEDIFHIFYDWYTIYHIPGKSAPASIEDVLDFIEANRPVSLPPSYAEISAPPKVSVILPVYGVEAYIEEALRSIQRQTLRDIEIIPVNDQSPDGCQAIIDRLAAEDPRIRAIRLKQNVGQGFARNAGIDAARGKYIWFLDSDDDMPNPTHLETVYDIAVRNNSDMVRGRKLSERVEDAKGAFVKWRKDPSEVFLSKTVECTTYADAPQLLHNRHFWNFLYKRYFLNSNNIRFLTSRWEERPFLLRALVSAERLSISTSEGVVYRIRPASTARHKKKQIDFDCQIENFASVVSILKERKAFDRDSPLRGHACFTLSQYLHYLFLGFPCKLARDAEIQQDLEWLVEKVANILQETDFLPSDLDYSSVALSRRHIQAGAYPLVLSAVIARKPHLVLAGVDIGRVPQALYYEEVLKKPDSIMAQALEDALNAYARNDSLQQSQSDKPAFSTPRVIVHVGSTKTGSTYLQHLMEKNRPELMRRGVWYPEIGLFWQEARPHKQAGHAHFAPAAIQKKPELLSYLESGLALMEGQIHTIVLSSEAFFLNSNSSLIAEYFQGYDLEMIVYLRRQDDWANSQYAEFVAGGAVKRVSASIEDWLEQPKTKGWLNYHQMIESWERAIGRERVHVRVYERDQMANGDLVSDFASATGLPELVDLPRPDERQENRGTMSTPHVAAIRIFNDLPFPNRDAYFLFIEELTDRITAWRAEHGHDMPKPDFLSPAQRLKIIEAVKTDNSEIALRYLGRKDGHLFSTMVSRAAAAETPLYGPEINIIAEAYKRFGGTGKKAFAPKRKAGAHKETALDPLAIRNYGLFGWRLWALTPMVRRRLVERGSSDMVQEFDRDPSCFMHSMELDRHRRMARYLYPQGNLFGPFGVFSIWVPILDKAAQVLRSNDVAKRIKSDPIIYFRAHPTFRGRILGRILFPIGELTRSASTRVRTY